MAIRNLKTGEIAYTGRVLSLKETSFDCGFETSFHAMFWNADKSRVESFCLGNSFERDYSAEVDATAEVVAAAQANYEALAAAREAVRKAEQAAEQAALPSRGKAVRVVRGRKVPIGTEGRVFWHGDSGYGPSVGLELKDGRKVFTAARNVEVTAQSAD